MRFPPALQRAIDEEAARVDRASLDRAAALLTERYKSGDYATAPIDSIASRLAYAKVRMPATFAANASVLGRIPPGTHIRSVLDLGAGPGTSMWAAAELFPSIERFTLIERDTQLIELGRRLAWHSLVNSVRTARWDHHDLSASLDIDAHDLVILSYALGELSSAAAEQLLRAAWAKTRFMFVLIEPGTPRNFSRLAAFRALLLENGAHPVAPCPHSLACPMAESGDWCHFSERLERTAEHRRIKSGSLGYEDEKFSYFIASKSPVPLPGSRIVRHPLKHKGHVQFLLCTASGLHKQVVSKSQGPLYKSARKAEWGDSLDQNGTPPDHVHN